MKPIEGRIEAGLFQPGFEQPPELAFAEMRLRPPHALPGEQPGMQRLLGRGQISPQAVAGCRRQPRLDRSAVPLLGLLLPDLNDLANAGGGGHVRDPQTHQVGAAKAGINRDVEERQITQCALLAQEQPDQRHLIGRERRLLAHHLSLVPGRSRSVHDHPISLHVISSIMPITSHEERPSRKGGAEAPAFAELCRDMSCALLTKSSHEILKRYLDLRLLHRSSPNRNLTMNEEQTGLG